MPWRLDVRDGGLSAEPIIQLRGLPWEWFADDENWRAVDKILEDHHDIRLISESGRYVTPQTFDDLPGRWHHWWSRDERGLPQGPSVSSRKEAIEKIVQLDERSKAPTQEG